MMTENKHIKLRHPLGVILAATDAVTRAAGRINGVGHAAGGLRRARRIRRPDENDE